MTRTRMYRIKGRLQRRRELDASTELDVDLCRAARHEGLIAHILARYADGPDF